jgi:DNA modification methylase
MEGSREYLDGKIQVHAGDCFDRIRELAECSVDSVVTDPPYALTNRTPDVKWCIECERVLGGNDGRPVVCPKCGGALEYQRSAGKRGFMGKQWDTGERAFSVEFWHEVFRVLKPGGHVLAFAGTRTYHRLACAIEDAGFEIRDQIQWVFSQGFPKSHNVSRNLGDLRCRCDDADLPGQKLRDLRGKLDAEDALSSDSEYALLDQMQSSCPSTDNAGEAEKATRSAGANLRGLRGLRCPDVAQHEASEAGSEPGVLIPMQRGSTRAGVGATRPQGLGSRSQSSVGCDGEESGLEGRCHVQSETGELRGSALRESAGVGASDGESGWIRDGASSDSSGDVRLPAHANGSGEPSGSEIAQQHAEQSGTLADERGSQAGGSWPICARCRKPMVPDGLGTALKPANEPICVARKPLAEPSVILNVLRFGVGALNIDGCRVPTEENRARMNSARTDGTSYVVQREAKFIDPGGNGRWPANLCHDNSDEVVGAFPDGLKSGDLNGETVNADNQINGKAGATLNRKLMVRAGDSGSAARFFYSAKADSDDRLGSKHPTVKPVDLMQYLVRLVTPKGGVVLDPFAGTGTTGEAAIREGCKAILIEREPEYLADIERRCSLILAGSSERRHATIKAKGKVEDAGPLFAGESA